MISARDYQSLMDIVDSAQIAISYVDGLTEDEFWNDMQCQDSVIRRIEIVGEAATRLSQDLRSELPHIPWRRIVGMRNVMIHQYDDVSLDIVWDTTQTFLPFLIQEIATFLKAQLEP
ncbi:MAG: DUF86 domain-containing protein [Cyanobacteria bacterium P01_F01_bin.4]